MLDSKAVIAQHDQDFSFSVQTLITADAWDGVLSSTLHTRDGNRGLHTCTVLPKS